MDYVPSWLNGAKTLLEKINKCIDKVVEYIDKTDELTVTVSGKQDTLTAGEGISIVNNVISATGGGGSVSGYAAKLYFHRIILYCENNNNEDSEIEFEYISTESRIPSTYPEIIRQYQERICTRSVYASFSTPSGTESGELFSLHFGDNTLVVEWAGYGVSNNLSHDTFSVDLVNGILGKLEIIQNIVHPFYISLEEVE